VFRRSSAGGAGAADAAVLVLAAGHALRRAAAGLVRPHGQLDRLPHQRALRRVPRPEGEGGRQLQEPRHPGGSVGRSVVLLPRRPAHGSRHLRNRFRLLSVWFPRHMVLRGWGAGNWNLIWAETESNE
jgi:hypothetical protein